MVTVDPLFAPVLQEFGGTNDRAAALISLLQPDGKILVGGKFTVASGLPRSGIARFNGDGTPDPAFDAGNISTAEGLLTVATGGTIEAIALQPDGKVLIGGFYRRDNDTVGRCLERLNSNGSVDTTFLSPISGDFASIADIEVQADGKIIVGGLFRINAVDPANGQTVNFKNLARLNTDGSFDFSFVPDGSEYTTEVEIQPDGKIVTGNAPPVNAPQQVVRFNTDGSVDRVLADLDGWVLGLELLPDGKFIVVGDFFEVNGSFQKLIVRLNADGGRDPGFENGLGFVDTLSFSDVAVQEDGKYIVCGAFSNIALSTRWRIARFNTDGSLDQTFVTSTPIAGGVGDVLLLPGGKIFMGGAFPLEDNNLFYNNIGRMNADATIDTNFNHANVIKEGEGYSILEQPDGKILVGGFVYFVNNARRRGIARLNRDGTLDTSFVPYESLASGQDLALQPDGKIIIVNSDSPSGLFRLNADGSRDTSFTSPFVPFSASIQQRTRITSVTLLADGKILVSGQLITGSATSPSLSGVARLNPDGGRDQTFNLVGAQGGVRDVYDIAVQPDGKIVLGGDFSHINANTAYRYLARVNADGTIDPSFNSPSLPLASPLINELELQPDGKIVFGGNLGAILRVNPNGSLDNTFNVPVDGVIEALTLQPDGRIMVGGGFTNIGGAARNRIARLLTSGAVDASLNVPNGANNIVYDFGFQADGNILVAGAFTKIGNEPRIGAARLIDSPGPARTPFDFDGDGRADISVYRPSEGIWYLMRSAEGYAGMRFGLSADRLAPADYDGDGKADITVYRNGAWYIMRSAQGFTAANFGVAEDIPQPADLDGDGKAEIVVYRPSEGNWYSLNLTSGEFRAVHFGAPGDKPVTGDYDGDGKADNAVFRPSDGNWYVLGSAVGYYSVHFGSAEDKPVPADYDGDNKTDPAVFRGGDWYMLRSTEGYTGFHWGIASDQPVAADYDGDGKADAAVFRNGEWYMMGSAAGFTAANFGIAGDKAVPGSFAQ